MLISRTQIITLHKLKTHANINSNEHANALATWAHELDHTNAATHTPYTNLPKRLVALNAKNTKQRSH